MEERNIADAKAWAEETFGKADLGDKRRNRRLVQVASAMVADPEGSLPRQMGGQWSTLKSAYRLLRAEGVTHESISQPVWQQTRALVEREAGVVLMVHDDTQLDYGYQSATTGLGPIGNGSHQGFFAHTVLAVVPTGNSERLLGVMAQEPWVRQPAPRQADGRKESTRQRRGRPRESEVWLRAVEAVGSPPPGQVWIHIGDRYADMLPFLQRCQQTCTAFVVRAAQNRRLVSEPEESEPELEHLLDRVKGWPAQAEGSIDVPSEHERRARQAQVRLSWGKVQLPTTDLNGRIQRGVRPVEVWVVRIWEPEPPSKQEAQREYVPKHKHGSSSPSSPQSQEVEPLEWVLLSALPVHRAAQAWQTVQWYSSRWPIEDFHRGLKTGCRLEQRHLGEQRSLANLLALLSPIAVRLLQLRSLCREEPEQPASRWVEPEEAEVIASREGVPLAQLTIQQFVFAVAQLGGFLRRTSDGFPGWQTLWQGWLRLRWFVAGMRFAVSALSP